VKQTRGTKRRRGGGSCRRGKISDGVRLCEVGGRRMNGGGEEAGGEGV